MLAATPLHVGAWRGEELVGYARALTDGVYRALIDDVVVDAPLRGTGVGAALVRHLLERLEAVEEVFLGCSEEVVPFYLGLGFERAAHPYLKLPRRHA
jgi:predicted GNAT family N-acyltransferase